MKTSEEAEMETEMKWRVDVFVVFSAVFVIFIFKCLCSPLPNWNNDLFCVVGEFYKALKLTIN